MFVRVIFTWALALLCAQGAWAMTAQERRDFLEAIRPEATRQAGQEVRFKVDRLNQDGDWAVLVGSVMAAPGKTLDWAQASGCDPTLDKMLWVVARRSDKGWQVKHMTICASEPPYWYLKEYGGFVWPCGVYVGLTDGDGKPLDLQCRQQRASSRPLGQ